jgi:hypothetical protein
MESIGEIKLDLKTSAYVIWMVLLLMELYRQVKHQWKGFKFWWRFTRRGKRPVGHLCPTGEIEFRSEDDEPLERPSDSHPKAE